MTENFTDSVFNLFTRHVSVRSFDSQKRLPKDTVNILMKAAQRASTSSNFQSWSAIIVENKSNKKQLAQYCANQKFIDEAPLFIIFCADASRHKWLTKERNFKFNSNYLDLLLVSAIDSALACQNALIMAESMGLGCCMVGSIRNKAKEVSEFLKLPKMSFATVGLAVGYPSFKNKVKPRLPKEVIINYEQYSTKKKEIFIKEYDSLMSETDIYKNRRVHVPGITPQFEEDVNHYGWIEHTARRMAKGNEMRSQLARFLEKQGFSLK